MESLWNCTHWIEAGKSRDTFRTTCYEQRGSHVFDFADFAISRSYGGFWTELFVSVHSRFSRSFCNTFDCFFWRLRFGSPDCQMVEPWRSSDLSSCWSKKGNGDGGLWVWCVKEAWKFKDERRMDMATARELQKEKAGGENWSPKAFKCGIWPLKSAFYLGFHVFFFDKWCAQQSLRLLWVMW